MREYNDALRCRVVASSIGATGRTGILATDNKEAAADNKEAAAAGWMKHPLQPTKHSTTPAVSQLHFAVVGKSTSIGVVQIFTIPLFLQNSTLVLYIELVRQLTSLRLSKTRHVPSCSAYEALRQCRRCSRHHCRWVMRESPSVNGRGGRSGHGSGRSALRERVISWKARQIPRRLPRAFSRGLTSRKWKAPIHGVTTTRRRRLAQMDPAKILAEEALDRRERLQLTRTVCLQARMMPAACRAITMHVLRRDRMMKWERMVVSEQRRESVCVLTRSAGAMSLKSRVRGTEACQTANPSRAPTANPSHAQTANPSRAAVIP